MKYITCSNDYISGIYTDHIYLNLEIICFIYYYKIILKYRHAILWKRSWTPHIFFNVSVVNRTQIARFYKYLVKLHEVHVFI